MSAPEHLLEDLGMYLVGTPASAEAYDRLASELVALRVELQAAQRERDDACRRSHELDHEAEATAVECDRLREALAKIERLSESPSWDDPSAGVGPIAREALADSNWCKRQKEEP